MSNDDERRKKFWEDDEDTNTGIVVPGRSGSSSNKPQDSADIDRKINEIRSLMDQTHQLYLQYFNGVEKRTPIEKLKMLESKIAEIQRTPVAITAMKFKVTQLVTQYQGMKDLWERKLKERERK
jgi:hypothetical protein